MGTFFLFFSFFGLLTFSLEGLFREVALEKKSNQCFVRSLAQYHSSYFVCSTAHFRFLQPSMINASTFSRFSNVFKLLAGLHVAFSRVAVSDFRKTLLRSLSK